MFLILSGEGSADIGIKDSEIGPNHKIDDGEIDLDRMTDLPSVTAFKDRLNEVLDLLGCPPPKL